MITIATTGSSTSRDHARYVPFAPEEIADEIHPSWQAGAATAHLHVRNAEGQACVDFERFRRVVELVRERCDVILNLSSSGLSGATGERRMRPLAELHPEMAFADAGSTNLGGRVSAKRPAFLQCLAGAMAPQVKPEIEVFEPGFINTALVLAKQGLLRPPLHFQFVLGGVARCSRHPQVSASRSRVSARRFDLLGYRGGEGTVSHGGHGHRHGRAHELSRAKCIGGRKNSAEDGGTS